MKLKVLKKIGKSVIDIGIQEVEDVNFARQLVEKGLAELVEGEIPEKKKRMVNKTVIDGGKGNLKTSEVYQEKTPKKKKKG